MKIFINTLTYIDKCEKPIKQLSIMKELIKNGYENIEIRREFISDFNEELKEISKLAKENNVELYYSIADTLYKDFTLDKKSINMYLKEAEILGSKTMKLSVGDYSGYNREDNDFIKDILQTGIKLYVENDQTFSNGRVDKIKNFLDNCKSYENDVRATFDIGNWLWVGEEPKKCADILKEYVDYVHIKDVKIVNGKYEPANLGEGIVDWEYFKNIFSHVPVGLEYPCGKNPIEVINKDVKKLL